MAQQEREEAQQLFETDPDALTADRTFEPGEGLVEAETPAGDEEMAAVPEPTVRKGPTPEQITAIKVMTPSHSPSAFQALLRDSAGICLALRRSAMWSCFRNGKCIW